MWNCQKWLPQPLICHVCICTFAGSGWTPQTWGWSKSATKWSSKKCPLCSCQYCIWTPENNSTEDCFGEKMSFFFLIYFNFRKSNDICQMHWILFLFNWQAGFVFVLKTVNIYVFQVLYVSVLRSRVFVWPLVLCLSEEDDNLLV